MKVFIKKPTVKGAWMWILEGYMAAWKHKGFDADYFNSLSELESEKDFIMMVFDWDLAEKSEKSLKT